MGPDRYLFVEKEDELIGKETDMRNTIVFKTKKTVSE